MAEPIPQITQDDETKISREQLRAVLAALGYDLPVSMADVQEQATNFVKLQDQIAVAIDEAMKEHALHADSSEGGTAGVSQERLKALSDMQDKLASASALLQTYAYEEFTDAKKLPTDLGVGQIQQLFKDGLIDEDTVMAKLGALNYKPADAVLLLESYKKNLGGGEEGNTPLSVSQVQALTKSGVLNKGVAKQKLMALKYSSADADALLSMVDDGASAGATGATGTGPKTFKGQPDPYGVNKAAQGQTYGNATDRPMAGNQYANPTPTTSRGSVVNQLNSTFSNFQDMMKPSLPKVERLPSPQEFLSDFGNAFDLRLSEATAGLSPDMQAFARSQLKSTLMSKYTAALGNIARNGVSPFKLSATPTDANAVQTVTADPGVQAKIARDGGLQTAAAAAGFTNEYVAVPKITPLEFLNQELSADSIKLMYEGSRSGAGVGPDKGNTQATLREGI